MEGDKVNLLEEEAGASASDNASPENRSSRSGSSRPSFTDYWRRTKEAAAKSITFVSSNLEQASGSSSKDEQRETDADTRAKSQARRAQVRKAQIQHRQRKANYTKQLEMDIAKLRDLIEQTEHEGLTLRTENDAIRRRLQLPRAPAPASASEDAWFAAATAGHAAFGFDADKAAYFGFGPQQFSVTAPEYTVNLLSAADSLDTPLFQVQRTATPSSCSAQSGHSTGLASDAGAAMPRTTEPGGTNPKDMKDFTEAETDHAINFILGLEHICWNHFHPSYYAHSDYDPEGDPEGKEHGHSLMASAIALQNAPPSTWQRYTTEKEQRRAAAQAAQPAPDPNLPPPSCTSTTTTTAPNPNPAAPSVIASWNLPPSTSGLNLTLSSLHGLATTLNPADSVEIAPVQAWFEIARTYGPAAVRDAAKMDALRAELVRDVDCLHFGAVIQRAAFKDTLERVLGPMPVR